MTIDYHATFPEWAVVGFLLILAVPVLAWAVVMIGEWRNRR